MAFRPPRLMSEAIANFQPGIEEVTFTVTPGDFIMTNASESDPADTTAAAARGLKKKKNSGVFFLCF